MPRGGIDLTEGDVGRHLVRLTIPMFLGISSMIVAAMIDTVYVGWIGTVELAAVSFTFPVVMALSTLPMGIGVGAASIIARVVGAGDMARVNRLSSDALLLSGALVVGGSVLTWPVIEPLFRLLGAREETLPLSVAYMRVWLLGLPMFGIPMVASTIMRSVGNARLPMILMSSSAALQVALAPLMIFGIPGIWEGLGFVGAAWGFVISRILTFMVTVSFLRRMQLLSFEAIPLRERMASWREVLAIGVPSMATNLIGPVSMAVVVALLSGYGHEVVAGFGVASRIESLAIMVLMALSASTGPFVGQNWGAGKVARIHRAQTLGYRFSHGWALLAFVVLAGGGRTLVGWINDDPAVIEATYVYLLLVPATYGFLGVGMVAGSSFVALGKPIQPLVLSITRMIVFFVPLAILFEAWFDYPGIYLAAAVCNVLMGGIAFGWVRGFLKVQTDRLRAAS